jgi:hypothetical protein
MASGSRGSAILLILSFTAGLAVAASAQNVPPVGILQMPPVSPEQAAQFFATRVVPPSDVPPMAPSASAQPLQSVNVDPMLGHDLPTDAVSPSGMPRADFAIAKPGGDKAKPATGTAAVLGARAPASTVIRQQPPTIGKP